MGDWISSLLHFCRFAVGLLHCFIRLFGAKVPILSLLYLTKEGGCTPLLNFFVLLTSGRELAFLNPFGDSNELFLFELFKNLVTEGKRVFISSLYSYIFELNNLGKLNRGL